MRVGQNLRKRLAGWLAGATIALMAAGQATAETLADTLASAYEHSGLLEQNRALLRAADENVAQAVATLRPIISYLAEVNYARTGAFQPNGRLTGTAALNADLLLWDGGATQYRIEALKETVLATRAALIAVEQDVLFRAAQAYMEVRRTSEFVALRQNNVRVITQEVRAAEDRFEVGEITRTDVSLAEARLAAARSLLAASQGDYNRAVAEFVVAVGREPGRLAPPTAPRGLPYSLAEAQQIARRTHPRIKEAQRQVAANELAIESARAAMQPSLTARGTVALNERGGSSESLGIRLSGPIYSGGGLASAVREAQARRDAARASLHIVTQNVDQGVANAYAILGAARASSLASQQQIRAARLAFRGVREEATLGARTTLDVLTLEQELLTAEANLISAQVDEMTAAYSALSAMGLLTVEYLGLGVQVYDPAAYYNLVDEAPAALSERGRALDRVLEAIGD